MKRLCDWINVAWAKGITSALQFRRRGWMWHGTTVEQPHVVHLIPVACLLASLWIVGARVATAIWLAWCRFGMHTGVCVGMQPYEPFSFTDAFRLRWPPSEFRRRRETDTWPSRPFEAWRGWRRELAWVAPWT